MAKKIPFMKALWLILVTAALTVTAVLVAINLTPAEEKIRWRIEHDHALDSPQFRHEIGALLGPPFIDGNDVVSLQNGDEIFPAMLAAIRSARSTITFETYIYWSGDIGNEFAAALAERARRGVKVHLLLDWVGSLKMDDQMVARMVAAGVQVRKFHPPHWSHLGRMNNRTHRKLLVIDGHTGFTGGVGIAPHWLGHAQDAAHWRDSHYKITGPVVTQLQAVFLENWIKVTGKVLLGPTYFPTLKAMGGSPAQMFSSSPTGGSESMQLMYLMAITASTRSIDLSAAYFVPDSLMTEAFLAAMQRGVRLRIIVPGEHIDSDTVRQASRARWGPLLAHGAVIAEFTPTMFHCKAMIVDGLLVSVGSTNFDNRSFRLNDEATLNVLDAKFAGQQTAVFERDLGQARRVTHAEWQARPWHEKLLERLASLIGGQL